MLLAVSILVFLMGVLSSPSPLQAQSLTVTGAISIVRRWPGAGKPDNADAVIWLKPVTEAARNPLRDENSSARPRFRIVQQHKGFEPRVLAVPAGAVVDFPNLDPSRCRAAVSRPLPQ